MIKENVPVIQKDQSPSSQSLSPSSNSSREKYIRYGDQILLRGSESPQVYLHSRCQMEGSIYNVQCGGLSGGVLEYGNTSEFVFEIFPHHYYEAWKALDKAAVAAKATTNTTTTTATASAVPAAVISIDSNKFAILQQRRDAEIELNNKRVAEYEGRFVTIGAEVMLRHVYSGSFIKATREKKGDGDKPQQQQTGLFHLKLDNTPSSAAHFTMKINPYLNFKRDGEKIAYDELIFFENIKYHSVFTLDVHPTTTASSRRSLNFLSIDSILKKKPADVTAAEEETLNELAKSASEQNEASEEIRNPQILEEAKFFQHGFSSHRKPEKEKIDTLQAVFVKKAKRVGSSPAKSKQVEVLWGDYVVLKHVMRSNKRPVVIHVEVNVCGFAPKALALVKDESNLLDKESVCDIFQLVPDYEELLGEPVRFDNENYGAAKIRLRHLLTGRFLRLNVDSMRLSLTHEEIVSQTAGVFAEQVREGKKKIIPKSSEGAPNNGVVDEKGAADIKQQFSFSETLHARQAEFREETSLTLMSASREEPCLRSTVAFQISSSSNSHHYYARISESEMYIQQFRGEGKSGGDASQNGKKKESTAATSNKGKANLVDNKKLSENLCDEDYFKPWFISMDTLRRKHFSVVSDESEGDFFFFEPAAEDILHELNAINCLLYPIVKLTVDVPKQQIETAIIAAAQKNIAALNAWVKGKSPSESHAFDAGKSSQVKDIQPQLQMQSGATAAPPSVIVRRQAMLREVGVLDMIIKIILHLFRNKQLCMDEQQVGDMHTGGGVID